MTQNNGHGSSAQRGDFPIGLDDGGLAGPLGCQDRRLLLALSHGDGQRPNGSSGVRGGETICSSRMFPRVSSADEGRFGGLLAHPELVEQDPGSEADW